MGRENGSGVDEVLTGARIRLSPEVGHWKCCVEVGEPELDGAIVFTLSVLAAPILDHNSLNSSL